MYTVNVLGTVKRTGLKDSIVFDRKYQRALKNCHLFSHLIILWMEFDFNDSRISRQSMANRVSKISTDAGIFATREIKRPNPLGLTTVRIIRVHQNAGVVEFMTADIPDQALVIDVKAHIPASDRVKEAIVPAEFSKLPDFIPEHSVEDDTDQEILFFDPAESGLPVLELYQIGLTGVVSGKSLIRIHERYLPGLKGLENFSHIRVIWWFHRFDNPRYRRMMRVTPPYENAPQSGVFATRSPVRPNPIGLTTAKLANMDLKQGILDVDGFDAFENTPIIDIRPYIPAFDRVESFKVPDWFKHWPAYTIDENEFKTADPDKLIAGDGDRLRGRYRTSESMARGSDRPGSKGKTAGIRQAVEKHDAIQIRGARQNNLNNIDVVIPHRSLTVITGVSGSGKSSLAFDTLYAEGQYRYLKTLSTTARQLTDQMEQPDVDQIIGLNPTIALEQRSLMQNSRSTVGSLTDIFSLLRVLFAKVGVRHCPTCSRAVQPQSAAGIADMLMQLPPELYFSIYPLHEEGSQAAIDFTLSAKRPSKAGRFYEHLRKAIQKAYHEGHGYAGVTMETGEAYCFCERNACPYCKRFFFEMTRSLFNNNNPDGMCPDCEGTGAKYTVDPQKIVEQPHLSLLDGASSWFGKLRNTKPTGNWMRAELFALADLNNIDLEKSWHDLPKRFRQQVLYGTGEKILNWSYDVKTRGRAIGFERPARGAVNNIKRLLSQTSSPGSRKRLLQYTSREKCSTCNGEKISTEARFVRIYNKRYPEVVRMTIAEISLWLSELDRGLQPEQHVIVENLLKEIQERIQALINIGLHYLTLDRSLPTLSGGETQRIRLAGQLNNELSGLIYILDEPSVGLHPRDNRNLLDTLMKLKSNGNTVIVVEHDAQTMKCADWLIDIGPGAGMHGGEVVACGRPAQVMENQKSITAKYLRGDKSTAAPAARKIPRDWIKLSGCTKNNLKQVDVRFPLALFTCVTGVSGSGKSSLVVETLAPILKNQLSGAHHRPNNYDAIEGLHLVDKLIRIDQSPIGRTPRSIPATYTGVFDEIRKVYARTPEAKKRKFSVSYFSFNAEQGQCETCKGFGKRRIELNFMPDVWVVCPDCRGARYQHRILDIKYKSKSIAEVLEMEAKDALAFFEEEKKVVNILQTLVDVGLEYIKLGQNAMSLSGGEAQRIKLAKELSQGDTGKTIYILDEPTTGLHFADIRRLLDIIQLLTKAGNTVIVIEHNLDVINAADWVIDLGPEGGHAGGHVVAQGTPEKIMMTEGSYTGRYLKLPQ